MFYSHGTSGRVQSRESSTLSVDSKTGPGQETRKRRRKREEKEGQENKTKEREQRQSSRRMSCWGGKLPSWRPLWQGGVRRARYL